MTTASSLPSQPADALIPPRFPSGAMDRLEHLVRVAADQRLSFCHIAVDARRVEMIERLGVWMRKAEDPLLRG